MALATFTAQKPVPVTVADATETRIPFLSRKVTIVEPAIVMGLISIAAVVAILAVSRDTQAEMNESQRMKPEKFTALVKKAIEHHGANTLADYFHVSIPTVNLWAQGKNLPYKPVMNDIGKYLESIVT